MKRANRTIISSVCCALMLSGLPILAAHDNDNQNTRTGKRGNNTAKQDHTSRKQQLGWVTPANHLIGHKIQNQQGNNLGEIRNLVLDFESGRILYVVVDPAGTDRQRLVAVPASLFRIRDDEDRRVPNIVARFSKQQLENAPRMTSEERQDLSDVSFATQVYKHFNQPMWWTAEGGQFGHVRRAAQVPGQSVYDTSNKKIGTLDQVVVDLPAGRIAYATLNPAGENNQANQLVLVPPMALTRGEQGFVLNADQEKLRSAPQARLNQQRRMSNLQFANQVYQFWGKDPWFQEGLLAPTGRSRGSGSSPNDNSSIEEYDDYDENGDDEDNASTSRQYRLNR